MPNRTEHNRLTGSELLSSKPHGELWSFQKRAENPCISAPASIREGEAWGRQREGTGDVTGGSCQSDGPSTPLCRVRFIDKIAPYPGNSVQSVCDPAVMRWCITECDLTADVRGEV